MTPQQKIMGAHWSHYATHDECQMTCLDQGEIPPTYEEYQTYCNYLDIEMEKFMETQETENDE